MNKILFISFFNVLLISMVCCENNDDQVDCIIGFRQRSDPESRSSVHANAYSLMNYIMEMNGTILYDYINFMDAMAVNIKRSIRMALEYNEKRRSNYDIEYIADNAVMHVMQSQDCNTQTDAGWCLARISNIAGQPNTYKYPNSSGDGVTVYVIDSGAKIDHPELSGKVTRGGNYVSGESNIDNNGHGTAVSSVIVGDKVGVAKKAKVVAIKAMNSQGSGNTADIIAGIQEASKNCSNGGGVINLSLGGIFNLALNSAVNKAFESGCLPVVAAGNIRINACFLSPSSARNAFTVTSSNQRNFLSSFSATGGCVKMIAPGENCDVAQAQNNGYTTLSGTSFSSPYTAGVAALILSDNKSLTPQQVADALVKESSKNTINPLSLLLNGTPNRLLHVNC